MEREGEIRERKRESEREVKGIERESERERHRERILVLSGIQNYILVIISFCINYNSINYRKLIIFITFFIKVWPFSFNNG